MKILYDPQQHFHTGFHKPMIDYGDRNLQFTKGHIDYFFPDEMRSPGGTDLSKEVLMIGSMQGTGEIIFSPHTLITNSIPWVVDVEHVDWFFMNDYLVIPEEQYIFAWKKKIAQKMLQSQWCRKILCRSNRAAESIKHLFKNEAIANKCVLFYPCQPVRKLIQNEGKPVNLGIINSSYAGYYRKGGDIALKIFTSLKRKYPDLQLIYVGPMPPKTFIFNPYKIPGFIHYDNLDHEMLISEILPKIDILLLPSRADTFGTVVLEAMSYGKAVVVSSGRHVFGINEIIKDGENGFVIQHPSDNRPTHACAQKVNIGEFIHKTEMLISNFELRKKLGANARKLIKDKLSTKVMNRILRSALV